MGSHLVIILIAVGVLWLSRKELPQWDISEAAERAGSVRRDRGYRAVR